MAFIENYFPQIVQDTFLFYINLSKTQIKDN